ncbi:unnamed protein product [Mytilus edulis]|uniref:Uncharacterized protein n=1 Tax=Mytilus edulis TaxID=6550 RepID=A0A8S3RRL0_MYTED|nr:unnamed protein product [Mytilus edulis]
MIKCYLRNFQKKCFQQLTATSGRGNSAFETAQAIYDRTNYVHMIGRHRIRLAWETHYVGDIRAINNEILDTYQLKSLDGFLEYGNIEDYMIVRKKDGLYLTDADEEAAKIWGQFENDPLQKPYDQIIRCLGFRISFEYFEEFPVNLIRQFGQITGESISNKSMIVLGLEYGEDYHGPSEDVFREDRAATEPRYAHLSNFLHPVLYFYHVPSKS